MVYFVNFLLDLLCVLTEWITENYLSKSKSLTVFDIGSGISSDNLNTGVARNTAVFDYTQCTLHKFVVEFFGFHSTPGLVFE